MTNQPLGTKQNYCSKCGSGLKTAIPSGDHKPRYVCPDCDTIHYENPRIVAGCVVEHDGGILLCKRAIEPRKGYWTVPAGFMELGETVQQAAARETLEEACAVVTLGSLLAMVDVVEAGQVHIFFRGLLADGNYAAGDESLEAELFAPEQIPWDDIAFRSVDIALKQYLAQKARGSDVAHLETATGQRSDAAV
jgi:ADP-ribose pyrophosphatase YjhB (NUDIX family)